MMSAFSCRRSTKLDCAVAALILGLSIAAIGAAIYVVNAMVPVVGQAIGNALWMEMIVVLIVLVISLTLMALVLIGHVTPPIVPPGPEWLVFGLGLLTLFEALKELLSRSP